MAPPNCGHAHFLTRYLSFISARAHTHWCEMAVRLKTHLRETVGWLARALIRSPPLCTDAALTPFMLAACNLLLFRLVTALARRLAKKTGRAAGSLIVGTALFRLFTWGDFFLGTSVCLSGARSSFPDGRLSCLLTFPPPPHLPPFTRRPFRDCYESFIRARGELLLLHVPPRQCQPLLQPFTPPPPLPG